MTDAYLQPYLDAQRTHGTDFDVTLWARPETQRRRFDVFCQMLYLDGKRVLDAGCSRGDFAAFMLERGVAYGSFVGVDGVPEVIEFANGRRLTASKFLAGDFVKDVSLLGTDAPQIVTISGTLNTMDADTAIRVLEGAWAGCSEALLFNFLSDRAGENAPPQEYPAKRLPTLKLLDWALSRTPSVQLRQDYFPHGHDATILMRREEV
ncbi:MAG: hypothetical protein AAGH99_05160 [Planctomycetota bacterium]